MIYIVAAIVIVAALFAWEMKRAPEMWICGRCRGEVIGKDDCPNCGERREP